MTATAPSSLAEALASWPEADRADWLGRLTPEDLAMLQYDWSFWARQKQLPPETAWRVWMVLSGRGFGKTRLATEWLRSRIERLGRRLVAVVGPTAADVRDVLVEGPSGLLNVCPPWNRPLYEPSKRRLTWPNGAMAILYSADEPDRLRGPQHEDALCDELAAWRYANAAFDNLTLGLRMGPDPRIVITTTPRPIRIIKDLLRDPSCAVTRGTSYENLANLAPAFIERIIRRYEGTRLGRQELHAEVLEDVPGALWTLGLIDRTRVRLLDREKLIRIVVAIDPPASSPATETRQAADEREEDGPAECGIVVAGIDAQGHGYVLEDASVQASPLQWAAVAVSLYHGWGADRIIAEVNQGGEMVETTIHTVDPRVSVKSVHASRGKLTRAEPVAALYERETIHHVGAFPKLEDQLTQWVPGKRSPDRLDAAVWAFTDLLLSGSREPAFLR